MNACGQRPTAIEVTNNYTVKCDYDGNSNLIYLGKAQIGSATSSAVWQIQKFTYDGSNNFTGIQWPGGESFVYIWDNRASLSWS